ncbi:hypothetical protein I3843_07G023300 [Carya illinoinensis]|uniref:Uncharacterized protein n=1 Tax=Carya illinoinensis TaxID=32201 RepID=A0A922EFG0_CARIL|nr:hypothetical protein I3842_07G024600 [Carya illinoinensis]KAG7969281.1 hypothetical protein I3843_07G023300 [Carya illinoinensis]
MVSRILSVRKANQSPFCLSFLLFRSMEMCSNVIGLHFSLKPMIGSTSYGKYLVACVGNFWRRKINVNKSNGLVNNITRTESENKRDLIYLQSVFSLFRAIQSS